MQTFVLLKAYARWVWYHLKWWFGSSDLKPLRIERVTRPVGGVVELFEVPQDPNMPYRLRYTSTSGKGFAGMFKVQSVVLAVMNNWAHGETDVPWKHILTLQEQWKIFPE